MSEGAKFAAGVWKRKHATRGQLAFTQAFAEWGRGEASLARVLGRGVNQAAACAIAKSDSHYFVY